MGEQRTAAASLEGLELPRGWTVTSRIVKGENASGGHFSESYVVSRPDGTNAFLKALDYSIALAQENSADALLAMTNAYVFERDLLAHCAQRRMSRVVLSLDAGEVDVPGFGLLSRVNYLIFESAEHDSRRHRDVMETLDVAWMLRSLHHVATGLSQLHGEGISHQDLKPSNVLVFEDESSKLADLGQASRAGFVAPFDHAPIPGDRTYAPPELLYGQMEPDETLRRRSSDMYQCGSMLMFFVTGSGTTAAIANQLAANLHWGNWRGSYSEVQPYVRDAFDAAVGLFERQAPGRYVDRLSQILRELCDPDPQRRGDPKERAGVAARFAIRRYVSRFDLLARDAELKLGRGESL